MCIRDRLGRSFYAVGGNSQSALMLGINVKRTKFIAHLLCGVLAGIGGFVYFLHVGSGSPSHASGAEMNAIASSIIGGTMLTGGVGNIIGTFFGVLSLSTIPVSYTHLDVYKRQGLKRSGASSEGRKRWTGVILPVSVSSMLPRGCA